MSKLLKEFKEFAVKGNVVDMAVGVVIGGAFGKIVSSLVNDLFMPIIGLITGGVNVSGMFALLGKVPEGEIAPKSIEEAAERGIATFNYGNFIQTVIDFILVALCIFLVIKAINKFKKPAPEAAPTTKVCPFCKSDINIEATKCAFCGSAVVADKQ